MDEFVLARIRDRATEEVTSAVAYHTSFDIHHDPSCLRIHITNGNITHIDHAREVVVREPDVIAFVEEACRVFPYKEEITCTVAIGLHDTYNKHTSGLLVFSRHQDARGQIVIPDLYAMQNYGGKLDVIDDVCTTDKIPTALFVGVTTGDYDPFNNKRLQLCAWAQHHPNVATCSISRVVQIPYHEIKSAYPDCDMFINNEDMSVAQQHQYKFLISVDGNTCAWDRLPWILNSKSICLKHESENIEWYYPLLQPGVHYIPFENFDDILQIVQSKKNNTDIVEAANTFVRNYLIRDSHLHYLGCVLHSLSLGSW